MPKRFGTPGPRLMLPTIATSVPVAGCSIEAQLLFDRLISQADDQGRLQGEARVVAALCMPLIEAASGRAVERWLASLSSAGIIYRYETGGRQFIQLLGWWENQGTPRRAYPSRYPAPDGWADRVRVDGRQWEDDEKTPKNGPETAIDGGLQNDPGLEKLSGKPRPNWTEDDVNSRSIEEQDDGEPPPDRPQSAGEPPANRRQDGGPRARGSVPSRPVPPHPVPSRPGGAPADGMADALEDYFRLTTRFPNGRTAEWLTELANEFGHDLTGRALAVEFTADRSLPTLLTRTQNRLRADAHTAERKRKNGHAVPPPETAEERTEREANRRRVLEEISVVKAMP